ncbi:MAG: hypothetical protein VX401_05920 [Pseudomonadota bacterium]|nr:hypothetical protein [Pseudomonadota bacterium]
MVDPAEVLGGWAEFTLTPPSEYFLNCLRSVAEATAGNGEPAYHPDIVGQLTTTIASRGYGPLLFRAVHVMSAAAMRDMRLDQLLVTDRPINARQAGRLLFADVTPRPEALAMRDGVLEFLEPSSGETVFKLGSRQVPVAVACLEFLVEALGFECLHNAFEDLADDHGSARRKSVTKDLSSRLYNFLGEHLPQVAERNLARLLAEHLESEIGRPKFAAEDVDDRVILDFWIEKSGDDTLSFKLFGTAARAWLTFRESLIYSRGDAFAVHMSLTATIEDEDLDRLSTMAIGRAPDEDDAGGSPDLGQLVGDMATPTGWLADLQRPPCSEIKFLTKTELAQIYVPALAGTAGQSLVLTCLRLAAFAPVQNRIVQASRNGRLNKDDIRREMAVISGTVYEDLLASWRSLQTTAENIATTAFLRLWESGSPAIFEYLSQSGDDDTRRQMAALATELQSQLKDADEEDDPVNLLAVTMLDRIDALPSDSPLIRQRRHMKRVAQSYRRQGLRAADVVTDTPPDGKHDFDTRGRLTGSDHIHALSCGGERLLKLAGFLASMDQPDQSADSQVRNDLEIFSNQFFHLHETTS